MRDTRQSESMIQRVVDDAGLTLKEVGRATGYDNSTVCRFLSGERYAPLEFYRDLFRATLDLRIVNFLHGDTGYASVLVRPPEGLRDDVDALQALVAEGREHTDAVQQALEILKDGINADDARALPLFHKEVDEAISALFAVKQLFSERVASAAANGRAAPRRVPPSSHSSALRTRNSSATGGGHRP